jgi:hypothetical protein
MTMDGADIVTVHKLSAGYTTREGGLNHEMGPLRVS